jgi:hypothetical protein
MNAIMVPVYAFIVLAAAIAVIMSLERVLGRPIPKLHSSLPVRRNRAFAMVLICMAASLALPISMMFDKVTFDKVIPSDCEYPCGWQTPLAILDFCIMALAFSGAIGWIVFAALWVTSKGWRLIALYLSN